MPRLRELRVELFLACLFSLPILWGLVSVGAGLFSDGILLSVEQPIPVSEVRSGYVKICVKGRAALTLDARVTPKLICDSCAIALPHTRVSIASGSVEREWKMLITPVDPDECGPCKVEGLISYSVPGLIWPLSYEYRTEWFLPVRGSDAGEN